MSVEHDTVYIKGERNVAVQNHTVTLGDILEIECSNKAIASKLKTQKLMRISGKPQTKVVVSILKVIHGIHEMYPKVDVQNLGETDLIVTYEGQTESKTMLYAFKIILVSIITFVGAAFSIMAFHNDISINKLFGHIYTLLTGKTSPGFTILEISYSIGLTIGILVFFNHFGKKNSSKDPTPMEVQMRLYEDDIQTTIVENASRKGREANVDTKESTNASWY